MQSHDVENSLNLWDMIMKSAFYLTIFKRETKIMAEVMTIDHCVVK